MNNDLDTSDLYNDGRKLRILKDLISAQQKISKASYGKVKPHKVSIRAQQQFKMYDLQRQQVLESALEVSEPLPDYIAKAYAARAKEKSKIIQEALREQKKLGKWEALLFSTG
jgi:aryl-alcohol dehydrogenase-like predicted oxidoreductase